MPDQRVINPLNAYKTVSDNRTMKADDGEAVDVGSTVVPYRAAGAISAGDVVCLLAPPDAVTPMSVTPKVTARLLPSVIGVAMEAATAAGQVIDVCTFGLAFVNVGAGTPAANNTATVQTNSAQAGVSAAENDATTIVGSILGVYLGAKDANNRAPVFVSRV